MAAWSHVPDNCTCTATHISCSDCSGWGSVWDGTFDATGLGRETTCPLCAGVGCHIGPADPTTVNQHSNSRPGAA